jgi:enoyl-CoA hydratase/carnithine racemase
VTTAPGDDAGIRYIKDGPVARVTVDRPHVLNALNKAAHAALSAVWDDVRDDPAIRVALLTGTGVRAFCAGTDIKDNADVRGLDYQVEGPPLGAGGLSLRRDLFKPIVAAVNGLALGSGFELALACDLIVAAEHAEFGFPEPRVGMMALDGAMTLILRQVSLKQAMGLLLTGRRISAHEARTAGLVNEVVPGDGLGAATDRWVSDILACAPLAVQATKRLALESRDLPSWAAPHWFPRQVVRAMASEDAQEGLRAFRERRAPQWKGR